MVRCSCGYRCNAACLESNAVDVEIERTSRLSDYPCIHRGQPLRVLDCGCAGDSTVYSCRVHGECMTRRLKPAMGPEATCNGCEDRDSPSNYAAILTTHFNPAGHSRLRETWRQWHDWIAHGYQCLELVLGDAEREIPGSIAIRGDRRNAIWQKERLINLAIESLPASVRYVAWLDHDLILPDRWLDAGCEMLASGFDAVQLFDRVTYLGRDGMPIKTYAGAAATLAAGRTPDQCPGGAWIASRSFLAKIGGIYDRNIVGGGDAVFFGGVTRSRTSFLDRQPIGVQDDARRWMGSVGECRWGYVRGEARHIWHGDRANRQYLSRDEILCRHGFDPAAHLRIGENGLLELSNAPDGLADEIARYFEDRRDDG
jgi:hypothetical protein